MNPRSAPSLTAEVTFHSTQPRAARAVTPDAAVDGRLLQFTDPSAQSLVTLSASIVRPIRDASANSRSVADSTSQPAGRSGIANRTRPRRLRLVPSDIARKVVCEPAVAVWESWLIQLSASAVSVTDSQLPPPGNASTVHECSAGDSSTLPAPSFARTLKVCGPTASPVYSLGESQAAQAESFSEHSNVAPASEEKLRLASVSVVVAAGRPEPSVVSGAVVSAASTVRL